MTLYPCRICNRPVNHKNGRCSRRDCKSNKKWKKLSKVEFASQVEKLTRGY